MSTQPKERPIILKAHEVRGVLDGTLTHLGRVVKPQPDVNESFSHQYPPHGLRTSYGHSCWYPSPLDKKARHYASMDHFRKGFPVDFCPYWKHGQRLWVKEKWSDCSGTSKPLSHALYGATYRGPSGISWRSSVHMPRWASRLTLEVTDVRVERNAESGAWEWLLGVERVML